MASRRARRRRRCPIYAPATTQSSVPRHDDADSEALLLDLDELVDAANGLASLAGLEPDDMG